MKLEISLVPAGLLDCARGGLVEQLDTAAKITSGRVTKDDIWQMVLDGKYQLWVVFEEATMKAYAMVLTEIKQYPQKKFLCVQHCVGSTGVLQESGVDTLKTLENFAKDQGCVGVEFIGRLGWDKFATKHGYDKRSVVYQKLF